MAKTITIQNRIIQFPESAESPNWAPAMVQFAEAVEAAIATTTGQYDVAPQVFNIDGSINNPTASAVDIDPLFFPNSDVTRVSIMYSVFRQTSGTGATTVVEGGTIDLLYDETKTVGNYWDMAVTRQGDAKITFYINDAGQLSYTTEGIGGSNHTGFISFRASAIQNS